MGGREVDASEPPARHWFNPLAAFVGPAYLRNAFTKGTAQEVGFLVDALGLEPGMRVLDAGCGPGRHALELARRGIAVVGVDTSPDFLALARAAAGDLPAEFHEADVRELSFHAEFDAVVCLCQGGFGLLGGDDDELDVVGRFADALRPGGRLALSAFSSYFVVRHLEPDETFDADTAVNHENAVVRDPEGKERTFDLWTTCYTPRELRLLAARAGLVVDGVFGVQPGRYARAKPSIDAPEHLLLAHRPK
ncbi:MAG TPA: class I SAM-dependent methyltransferase [Acidimicrobiia bacterium]|nr:class I SAM-dependent methyltransferase [Acidimicrobiia bacterium]